MKVNLVPEVVALDPRNLAGLPPEYRRVSVPGSSSSLSRVLRKSFVKEFVVLFESIPETGRSSSLLIGKMGRELIYR